MAIKKFSVLNRLVFISVFLFLSGILFSIPQQDNQKNNYLNSEDSLKSLRYLSSQISKVLSSAKLGNTSYEVAVYSIDNGKYYFKKNIDELVTPASITKIFTCYSSLLLLDKNYQYKTKVYYSGKIENNILNGNIYIVGDGDPKLTSSDLVDFAKNIHDKGINQINGNIIADGSCFDNITNRVEYSGDKEIVQALQPISGLSIEQNTVTVTVEGTTQRNSRLATVRTNPASITFQINNTARIIGHSPSQPGKRSGSIEQNTIEKFGGPLSITETTGKSISISQQKSKNDIQVFNVSGNIDAGDSYSYSFYIDNPVLATAGSLYYYLKAAGVVINGSHMIGKLPDNKSQVNEIVSKQNNLLSIVSETLKNSDNYLAENIFKKIGSHSGKMIENAKEARTVISNLLSKNNLNCTDCNLFDGSGLSRRNKITGKTVIGFICSLYKSDLRQIIDTTLAIAGLNGTIKNRMIGTLAQNNLIAKTGTHKNVSGLCGIVHTLDGESLAFSFIFNGDNIGEYKKIENQLGIILSEFFYFNREQ